MNDKTAADSSVNDSPTIADSSGRGTLPDSSIDDNITFADYKAGGSEWETGDVIMDTYEVTGVLGKGGMGKVFKVHHRSWNADLAVKSALPELIQSQKGIADFIREAETWTNLGLHPHIVYCYYVRTIDGIPRVFAEYVKGGSLSDCIANRTLYESNSALAGILDIAIQTAWGLQYAHEQGLIHQDVKPANILMTESGMAKITDFGIASARSMAGSASGDQTVDGTWGGMTPGYCSPEQAEIAHQASTGIPKDERLRLTHRTDIWSWAATVLEMFLGERTWPVGQVAGFALENYDELKQALSSEIPAMPDAVRALLARCFQMDEADRPETMTEAADELARIYESCLGAAYPREAPKATKLRAAALNNRAVSLYDLGKKEEAEALWKLGLADEPHHPESTYNLGLIEWSARRITDDILVQRLEEAARTNTADWVPQYLLAQVHMERSDFESAAGILANHLQQNDEMDRLHEAARSKSGKTLKCLRLFEDHTDGVISVSMSADGRYALSGDWSNTLRLWDMTACECLEKLNGYKACLSTDGRHALYANPDHALVLWETAIGKSLRTFEGHKKWIHSVCMSADGQLALSGSEDETLRLWEIKTGKCLRTFEGHTERSVCISADGRFALSGNAWGDHSLKLWDLSSGDCLRVFEGHTGFIGSVCMSADGCYALSGSEDQTMRLWDIAEGKAIRLFEGHTRSVNAVCLSADSRYALSGGNDNTLRLWNIATGKCLHTFGELSGWVQSVCMDINGRYALSGCYDNRMLLWNIDGNFEAAAPVMLSRLPDVSTIISEQSELEKYLVMASEKGKAGDASGKYDMLQRIKPESKKSISAEFKNSWAGLYRCLPKKAFLGVWSTEIFKGDINSVYCVCMDADGRRALTGGWESKLKLWDIASGECTAVLEGRSNFIKSVCMSADGRYAISDGGERDSALWLWDISAGQCLRTLEGHDSTINSIRMSADGRYALSASSDKTVKLWDLSSGRCVRTIKDGNSVRSACLSEDGRLALTASGFGIKLWDMLTGSCIRTFEVLANWIGSACMSKNGRYALSGDSDHAVKLWDITTGKCIYTLEGHTSGVTSVFMSADGRYALSASSDKTVKLWDISTGECIDTLAGHTGEVNSVCISPDGRSVLSGSTDGTLRLWGLYWDLEPKEPADWDEGAKPYAKNFLALHTPYMGKLPENREPTEREITLLMTRKGKPFWTEEHFQRLLFDLGCAGYGWLKPEGVRAKLAEMAEKMRDGVLKT